MKRTIRFLVSASLAAILAGGISTSIALADAPEGGKASCMAYEASDVSPPGSTTGATNQFGMPGVMNLGVQNAVDAGFFENRGGFIKAMASGHLESHEACDAVFGLDPDTE